MIIIILTNILSKQITNVDEVHRMYKQHRQEFNYSNIFETFNNFNIVKKQVIENMKQLIHPSGGKKRNKTRKRHKKSNLILILK